MNTLDTYLQSLSDSERTRATQRFLNTVQICARCHQSAEYAIDFFLQIEGKRESCPVDWGKPCTVTGCALYQGHEGQHESLESIAK